MAANEKCLPEEYGYELHRWGLISIGDMIAASGNLHGRPGYPDGTEIMTSAVLSWDYLTDSVLLYTENSIYKCPLQECVNADESLSMLRNEQGGK